MNQREKPSHEPFRQIMTVTYGAGEVSTVTISNEGTDGHVIIDAVQWLKTE